MVKSLFRPLVTIFMANSIIIQWVSLWMAQVVFIAVSYPFTTLDQRRDICSLILRRVTLLGMDVLNPFWTVRVLNKFPEVKNTKIILVMSHASNADSMVMQRAIYPRDGSWVAKSGIFKLPFGGWALTNADDLRVEFADKKKSNTAVKGTVGKLMADAATKLRRGRMICVFPEGTRNRHPEGPIQPFKLGFFRLAIEEGAVVVPLATSGTERLWPSDSAWMDSSEVYMSFGQPLEARDFSSAEELAQATWNIMNEIRETHPDRKKK